MGQCLDRSDAASKISQKIDQETRNIKEARSKEIKILLLGPGESGKSTVFKQMKIIQDDGGFSDEELMGFRHVVHANCISQMRVLVQAAAKSRQQFEHQENVKLAQQLIQLPQAGNVWTPEIGLAIKKLWADKGIQNIFHHGENYTLNDTAEYFFSNIDRFLQPEYVPSVNDVLRVRVRSTGIEEAEFAFDKMTFKVVDVGGQRSERRKWIHCFDCVTSVLFCAALSAYDQTLREDGSVNRMEEALNLFEDVAGSSCFKEASIILFLNKTDLFQEKIKKVDLKTCFEHYTGGPDFQRACEFIEARFRERVANGTQIYVHFTCAINTENIEYVINDVRTKVLSNITKQFVFV